MAMVLYAGTRQGLVALESKDGESWEQISQGPYSWEVPKLFAHPDQPNRVYAGTRGDGVYVSDDFGKTWVKPCYGRRGPGKVRCVTADARDINVVYAGTEPIDIWVSYDGARSWEIVDSVWDIPQVAGITYPVPMAEPHVREIVQDPREQDTWYAALQVGYMIKSTDNARTWRLLDKGLDEDVHTIAIDPTNTRRMFIATGGEGARAGRAPGRAFYRSLDAGESWTPTALEYPHYYSIPLAMNPKQTDMLYGGMASGDPRDWNRPTGAESLIIRTENGGESWETVEGALKEASVTCPAAIMFDEVNPDNTYIGYQNGDIYMSRDGGGAWRKLDVKLPPVASMQLVYA